MYAAFPDPRHKLLGPPFPSGRVGRYFYVVGK
jgi:hypothetical protein